MGELLEREDVLADLSAHLALAAGGEGRLVVLRGEAGAGKTAVLGEFARRASPVADVLVGACDPLSTPRPLGPLLDVGPRLGGDVELGLRRARARPGGLPEVFGALLQALRGGRPKVLVFEDLHWADEATLDLLCLLARRIEHETVLLVVSYRDDEIGPAHPLRALLGGLVRLPTVSRAVVGPLTPDGVAALAVGRRGDVDELVRLTGGNPFLVTELLGVGVDRVPAAVTEAVGGRLSRVSSSARSLAAAVAVVGPSGPASLVAAVVDDPASVEELLGVGLLDSVDHRLGFRYELTRRAVLGAIPEFHRTEMSSRVLAVLRSDPRWRDDAALLAHHAAAAGDGDAVLEYAPAAARRAATSGCHREAVRLYRRALHHGSSLSSYRRATMLERLARSAAAATGVSDALAALDDALELRQQLGDRLREGDDRRRWSALVWQAGRATASRDAAKAAVRILEPLPVTRELGWAYLNLCQLSTYDHAGVDVVAEYTRLAVSIGGRFEDHEVVLRARFHRAAARLAAAEDARSRSEAWAEMEHLCTEALASGLTAAAAVMATVTVVCATVHREHGRADAAHTVLDDHARGLDVLALCARGWRPLALLHRGSWGPAADLAASVLDEPAAPPVARVPPLSVLARLRARRGEPGVWPLLDEASGLVQPAGWTLLVHAARAEAAWLDGDHARARDAAERGLDSLTPHTDPWVSGELARWADLAGGGRPAVRAAPPFALELAGDWPAAARAWEQRGCAYDAALARLAGDVPALISALDTFVSLGARAAETVARSRLRDRGVRLGTRGPRAGTRTNRHGLTTRQLEILTLVGEGLTGPQIGRRLHISPKTANNHVSAILTKLDVRTRAEAADCL